MKYQVRKAAGMYWLTDIANRNSLEFKKPMAMNESGFEMWQRLVEGKGEEDTAKELAQIYDIDCGDIIEDVKIFKKTLLDNGINLN